ncbi:hypothetical protein [Planctomicrobium sp. SH527]|uniref:hypothetical protein n=1 Tax=Planctomicrobium sp. SH527 TaxID=3448123 RepID=UPI003F5BEE40
MLVSFCAFTGSVARADECDEFAVPWGILTVRSLDQAYTAFNRASIETSRDNLNATANRIALLRIFPGIDSGRPLTLKVARPAAGVDRPIWIISIPVSDAMLLINSIKQLPHIKVTDHSENRWLLRGYRGEMNAVAQQNRLLISNLPNAFACPDVVEELSHEPVAESDFALRIQPKGISVDVMNEVKSQIRSRLNRISDDQLQDATSDTRLEVATLHFLNNGITRWIDSIDWFEAKLNLSQVFDVDIRIQATPGSNMERDLKKIAPESTQFFRPPLHPVAARLAVAVNVPGEVQDLLAIAFEQVRDRVSSGMKMTLHPKDQEAAVGGFQTIISTISLGRIESYLEIVSLSNSRVMSFGSIRAQRTDLMAKSLATVFPLAEKAGDLKDVTMEVVKQGDIQVHRLRPRKYRKHDIVLYGPDPFLLIGTNRDHYFFTFGGTQPEATILGLKQDVVAKPDLVSASFHLRPWIQLLQTVTPNVKEVARVAALFPAGGPTVIPRDQASGELPKEIEECLQVQIRADSNQLQFHLQADSNLLKLARLLKSE